jgi:hypothetical protein
MRWQVPDILRSKRIKSRQDISEVLVTPYAIAPDDPETIDDALLCVEVLGKHHDFFGFRQR